MIAEQPAEARKKAALLSFSARGALTARALAKELESDYSVSLHAPKGTLKETTAELFASCSLLVFVGSCGIAVRAIAPCVVSKTSDPAVLVCDECGNHVISLLSGHIGGANALTLRLAEAIGGDPVVTTATDVNHRFSVDAWAAVQGYSIGSMKLAKRFSAEILQHDMPLHSEFPMEGAMPAGVVQADRGEFGAVVSCRSNSPFEESLYLVPKAVHLGIGCKRDTPVEKIEAAVKIALEEAGIFPEAIADVSSIDVKQDEAGLLAFCAAHRLPALFYSAEVLNAVPGSFTGSEFVKKTVGVDSVCERSAAKTAGEGYIIYLRKFSKEGVTVAAALSPMTITF